MNTNELMNAAKKNKADEFYTQYEDIAKEIPYYKEQLADKIIYCNCDNPKYSNFYKYLKEHFSEYKLKQLIATHIGLYEYYSYKPKKYIFDGQTEIIEELNTNGDFRSYECINILQTADIVITNPPFSLFREFISLMSEYNKKFLILGNINAIAYKEIFPLIKDNKIHIGYSIHSGDIGFIVPNDYSLNATTCGINENNNKYIKVKGVRWFTNLNVTNNFQPLKLTKTYNEIDYPKYDNFNAINVDKTTDIPIDYNGLIGVPITFIDKWNPDKFEIVLTDGFMLNGKQTYKRLIIKRKS